MNQKKFKSIFRNLVIIFAFLTGQQVWGQAVDTTIIKSFNPGKDDIICIKNPSFDVKVETWDKSELKIEYHLSVEAGSDEAIHSFLSAFERSLDAQTGKANPGKVIANVQFDEYSNNFNRVRLKLKDEKNYFTLEELQGSLVIYMPKKNPLDAQTSFHKLEIGSLDSDATIRISSSGLTMGNCKKLGLESSFSKNMKIGKTASATLELNSSSLDMEGIDGDLSLKASFSDIEISAISNKATVRLNSSTFKTGDLKSLDLEGSFIRIFRANNIGECTIRLNSSTLEAKKITALNVEKISFSTLNADEVTDLTIGSCSSSKFFIEKVSSVKAESCSFSDFKIGNLTKLFSVSANSGTLNIDNIARGFDKIDIRGNFLTANLRPDSGCEFTFTSDMTFGHCETGDITIKKNIKEMSHETIEGWKGNEKATSAITINCQSCRVNLK
jgi:hypothetical protein